jgi:hypothetical protein
MGCNSSGPCFVICSRSGSMNTVVASAGTRKGLPTLPTQSLHAKLFIRMTIHLGSSRSISQGFRSFQSDKRTIFKTSVFPDSAVSFQSAEQALRFSSGRYFEAVRFCGQDTVLFCSLRSLAKGWMPSEFVELDPNFHAMCSFVYCAPLAVMANESFHWCIRKV